MEQKLIDVVKRLKTDEEEMSKYLDSIPSDIRDGFFDNFYANAQVLQRDYLVDVLFGVMAEDVQWFLYEFIAGKSPGPHCVLPDGTEFTYNTNEDYYEYLRLHG